MEVLIVVLMTYLTVKDGLLRVLLMNAIFCAAYVNDHYYFIGSLVLLYIDVCRGCGDVGGMVGIHRVNDVGGYIFQMVICYFIHENSSKVMSY